MSADRTPVTGFELTWTDGGWPDTDAQWLPAVVPGGVHESLLAAGRLEHPYLDDHEHDLGWVHEATWFYRARVTAPPGTLVCEGLDTVAEVWVDGALVGAAANQHRRHEFALPDGVDHEIALRFPPPLDGLLDDEEVRRAAEAVHARQRTVRPHDPPTPDDEVALRVRRMQLRKATFSWGWDFAPVVTSRGVSGPVAVVHTAPVLTDLHVRSRAVDVHARTATLEVTGRVAGGGIVQVEVTAPDGAVRTVTTQTTDDFQVRLDLTDVALWWTADLGDPALYDVLVTVTQGEERVAERRLRHGVRTLVLDRSEDPDEEGRLFRFVLNGHPLFARGANWVPPSMLVASIQDAHVRELVRLSRDAGMTMLRVWGGGVYPGDAFYDACDELGVLVWQDFMFACDDYPDPHGRLAPEIELEATEQVRRLRHHASLALWCGENEVQAIHELVTGDYSPGEWGWSIFRELLPRVVAEHDPDTPYWPGSPWGERTDEILNGTRDGDRHAWEVWHGIALGAGGPTEFATRGEAVHFARYEHDRGRFISEFGIHASPELATLQRWTTGQTLALGSAALDQRNKDTPKDKGSALMEHETGLPTTLQEYADFTMACQAEGLKFGVEHYRRREPHCSGTLVWQLNDSWPGLSWSVIDFDLVPKAGYWFLQRCYGPLLASFRATDDALELWVSNSSREPVDLALTVEVGGLVGAPAERHDVAVTVAAATSRPVWSRPDVPGPDQVAWVSEASGLLPANRRFFAPLRALPLRASTVHATVEGSGPGWARVRLTAHGYAYLARVLCDRPGARFSTNYVDLRDGQSVVIDVTDLPAGAVLSVSSYGAQPRPIDL